MMVLRAALLFLILSMFCLAQKKADSTDRELGKMDAQIVAAKAEIDEAKTTIKECQKEIRDLKAEIESLTGGLRVLGAVALALLGALAAELIKKLLGVMSKQPPPVIPTSSANPGPFESAASAR